MDGYKLGRKPRAFHTNIPHLTALNAGKTLLPPPAYVDYTHGMPEAPDKFGFMLNNRLGDCTCAAFYHARQVWTFHSTGKTATASDIDVSLLYEKSCGYDLNDPGSDQGGVEQDVLTYIEKYGAPIGMAGPPYDKIASFAEVDCRRIDDIKRTIYTCGVAYIGFNVPQNILPADEAPPHVWSLAPTPPPIIGGHAVVLPGYDAEGAIVISWGRTFKMTWEFFATYVDEAYAIIDFAWAQSNASRKALDMQRTSTVL